MTEAEAHWLWRLDADAWMRSALTELEAGADHVAVRRTALTHARRAAGMALNAVLVAWARAQGTPEALAAAESRWGRSYVDHLRLLGDSGPENQVPLGTRAAESARALMAIPVAITAGSAGAEVLVQIHRGPNQAAQQGLDHARTIVHACATAIADLRTAAL
ncbi:hypothetical protein SAMN02745121_08292 [Nannocystis exedens]|uniref:Uncharacterized protein n=1 Tax=Nannocystis exedens TaxID=54 RepID=A0A1I2HYT3_9BACT|nr:hypothetical protein [Nannocystis exedens]PCC66396.1 hypothetical protein NAEX_08984 [Nannocystis exedens]SFF34603.1 hypothetical protein SAMN02745121_08292 [Nannocystis exedens]